MLSSRCSSVDLHGLRGTEALDQHQLLAQHRCLVGGHGREGAACDRLGCLGPIPGQPFLRLFTVLRTSPKKELEIRN